MFSSTLLICLLIGSASSIKSQEVADDECKYEIVESMPDKLSFNGGPNFKLTHESLIEMINNAKDTIKIASFYWTLSAEDEFASDPSAKPGKDIMDSIENAVKNRNVKLEVILDRSSRKQMSNEKDMEKLNQWGELKFINMSQLLKSGILHTKFLIADGKTFYVGSSNFDWRSYLQIKEIGISFTNCEELAKDLDKVFKTYSYMSTMSEIPDVIPDDLSTKINLENPLRMKLGNLNSKVFIGSSPPAFNGLKKSTGRTHDIDGLLHIIDRAHHRVDISVMNYNPRTEFIWPKKYWPRIDDALRRAASERRVKVRLLFSNWTQNKPEEMMWYRSLNAVQSKTLKGGGIHVKLFKVPIYDDFEKSIPYARVKHDKYMVTDRGVYIGTSNWAPDYFINTCGVSVVIEPEVDRDPAINEESSIIKTMQNLFDRDFNSEFAQELPQNE